MFLDWVVQLGLLKHDPDLNVLAAFPLSVRRGVVSLVVEYLCGTKDLSFLTSAVHLQWVMEVIGQGLALPIEDADLTSKCIELYNNWLQGIWFPNSSVPPAIYDNPQLYFRRIMGHYSLLFAARRGDVARHAELCQRTLDIAQLVYRAWAPYMTAESWAALLRLLLGITDSVIVTVPAQRGDLADSLCGSLVAVLFDAWLHACVAHFPSQALWASLRTLCAKWRHRMPLVTTWNATLLGLTERMMNILHGPKFGPPLVTVSGVSGTKGLYSSGIAMPDDCVLQCWQRMLHIIVNPNLIMDAEIYLTAMQGVSRLVDTLLYVEKRSPPDIQDEAAAAPVMPALSAAHSRDQLVSLPSAGAVPSSVPAGNHPGHSQKYDAQQQQDHALPSSQRAPSGNSVLHVFGAWLFEAVSRPSGYEEGKAEAYYALCRIFSSQQAYSMPSQVADPFIRAYLARFYATIARGLQQQQDSLGMTAILLHVGRAFALELEGSRVLVPRLIAAAAHVLGRPTFGSSIFHGTPITDLRRASIHLLGMVLPLANHFGTVDIHQADAQEIAAAAAAAAAAATSGNGSLPGSVSIPGAATGVGGVSAAGAATQAQGSNSVASLGSLGPTSSFAALRSRINDLLIAAFETTPANDNGNWICALCALHVQAHEEIHTTPLLAPRIVRSVLRQLERIRWNAEVTRVALDVLSGVAPLQRLIAQTDGQLAREVVLSLCGYIDSQAMQPKQKHTADLHSMIVGAYQCMLHWVVGSGGSRQNQWILRDKPCLDAVIEVVELGLTGAKSRRPGSASATSGSGVSGGAQGGQSAQGAGGASGAAGLSGYGGYGGAGATGASGAAGQAGGGGGSGGASGGGGGGDGGGLSSVGSGIGAEGAATGPLVKETKSAHPASKRVQEMAELVLVNLLNHLGNFPPPSGPSGMSTLLDEGELLAGLVRASASSVAKERPFSAESHIRYFVVDNGTILGLLERPSEADGPGVTMIVRDQTGKYSWNAHMMYMSRRDYLRVRPDASSASLRPRPSEFNPRQSILVSSSTDLMLFASATASATASLGSSFESEVLSSSLGATPQPTPPPSSQAAPPHHAHPQSQPPVQTPGGLAVLVYTADRIPPIHAILEGNLAGLQRTVDPLVQAQAEKEAARLARVTATVPPFPDPGTTIDVPPTADRYRGECKFQTARLLMSHLGLLSSANVAPQGASRVRARVLELEPDSRLAESLRALDATPARDCERVSVVYVYAGQRDSLAIAANGIGSADYAAFLHSLGWPVLLRDHPGFSGGLDAVPSMVTAPYHSDPLTEIVFRCPALATELGAEERRALVREDAFVVAWVEDMDDAAFFPYAASGVRTVLCVNPMRCGLFRVRVVGRASAGPLLDGMVVSRRSLGTLVRQTALNTSKKARLADKDAGRPLATRKRLIEEAVSRARREVAPADFYTSIFTDLPAVGYVAGAVPALLSSEV